MKWVQERVYNVSLQYGELCVVTKWVVYWYVCRTLLKQGPYGGKPVVRRVVIVTPGSLVKVNMYCITSNYVDVDVRIGKKSFRNGWDMRG